jgi:hypothetical protein
MDPLVQVKALLESQRAAIMAEIAALQSLANQTQAEFQL